MAIQSVEEYVNDGFGRTMDILDMIYKFPDRISNEDIEGAARFVNPDIRNTVWGLLDIPGARDLEVLFIKRAVDILREAERAKEEGKKIVYIPFTFPPEIIFAFDNLFPICTEILAGLIVNVCAGQGERYWDFAMGMGLPDSLCSANTITTGALCMGSRLMPDAIVSNAPGSCNPNAKIHAFAAEYLGVPQFILEKPTDESPRGRELYYRYMTSLIEQLERFAQEELTDEKLRGVLEKVNTLADLYQEFWELKKFKPCPVHNIFNATLLFVRSQFWGRDEAVEVMRGMIDVSKERVASGEMDHMKERARVYVSYIYPLFDLNGFFTWAEREGISVLGDVLAIHFFPPLDLSCRETMIRGLSEIAFEYPMTRQMGGSSISVKWLEDIGYAVKELEADCCIYIGHHACKHTAGSLTFFRKELMRQGGVPTLTLVGDSFDKRHTPMSMIQSEIQSFVEKVAARKKPPRRKRKPASS